MTIRSFSIAKDILRFEGTAPNKYWRRFAMLLALAVVIATMGLIRNSGAVVIAAMLIAPLMTPILGIAASMVMGWTRRTLVLLARVLLAALCSVGLAWLLVFVADVPRGILIPDQVTARTDPGIEDLIIALASGVAGAYVKIQRSEISLLPGAAIGVSLVPPLAAAGILLYFGEPWSAYEAGLLFVTNLAAIVLSASVVYMVSGPRSSLRRRAQRLSRLTGSLSATLLVFLIVAYQLGTATLERYREGRLEEELAAAVTDWADPVSVEIVRLEVKPRLNKADLWLIIDLPFTVQTRIGSIADLMPEKLKNRDLLNVLEGILGRDYEVAIRYQTRIAGIVDLGTERAKPAPTVEEVVGE